MTSVELRAASSAAIPDLDPRQELAVLARILHREAYDDYHAGHISYRQADGTLLVNPWELTWAEVRASDILRVDADGNLLEGDLTPSPALLLHYVLHRARPDVGIGVHHHPHYATIWASLREVPRQYTQYSAFVADDLVLYDSYEADVSESSGESARRNVEALGTCSMALLANHGVLVVGATPAQTLLRCTVLEQRCRAAWHVEALGRGRGTPMPERAAQALARVFETTYDGWPHFWEAMVRRELRADRSVLS